MSAARRSPPSFRVSTRASSAPKQIRWRLYLSFLCGIFIAAGLGWYLTRQPRGYECLTTVNTICPPELEQHFQKLQETPLWRLQGALQGSLDSAQDPRLITASLTVTPLQIAKIQVELAEPLFPYTSQQQQWQMLSNGRSLPATETSFPSIEFVQSELSQNLSDTERIALKTLYDRLRSFSPRVRKILVLTSTEVEVYPENAGKILFTLQDVERQLATLQAFFRSTTMNQTYQVLDVRFSEVAVIKE